MLILFFFTNVHAVREVHVFKGFGDVHSYGHFLVFLCRNAFGFRVKCRGVAEEEETWDQFFLMFFLSLPIIGLM